MLKKVCDDHPKEWHSYLPLVLFAYREVKQDSTGFSPFELVYGRTPRGPADIFKDQILELKSNKFDAHDLVRQTREKNIYSVQQAQENCSKAAEKNRII